MQNDIITYTQHTGEVAARGAGVATHGVCLVETRESVHKACCPAGEGEGSRVDVFVGTQKAVRTRESAHSSAQASGRSMIEMLGVLAIIGALSVGGLAALRVAQSKLRANVIANDAMLAAADVLPRLEILFQNANAASTTEELTPTFKPKNDTMEIWRCGTDGAEIIFNDVKKEVCENLMKITQIKGVASFGAAANNATACPDVPNNVELFGECTDLNQMVFSVGQATELCGGRMCNSNEYCKYTATGCHIANRDSGTCTSKGDKPASITITNPNNSSQALTFFKTPSANINWWSAKSWCHAHGGSLLSFNKLGCKNVIGNENYCNTDQSTTASGPRSWTINELKSKVGGAAIWLAEEYGNDCNGYVVLLYNDGEISNQTSRSNAIYYAVCVE